jgi:hypothetical protein
MTARVAGAAAAALALLASLLSGAPSSAADQGEWYGFKHRVMLDGQRKVAKGLCIEWKLAGALKFTVKHYGRQGNLYYKRPRLVDPVVSIRAYDRCVNSYTDYRERRRFYGADLSARTYGSTDETCDWNPSVSAGWPWAVNVTLTPECGNKTKTRRGKQVRVEPNRRVHHVYMDVNGVATRWDASGRTRAVEDGGFKHWVCFSHQVFFTIYRSSGDSAGGIKDKGRREVDCVNIWEATPYA